MQCASDATLSAAVKKNPRDVKVRYQCDAAAITYALPTHEFCVVGRVSNFPRPLILESEQLARGAWKGGSTNKNCFPAIKYSRSREREKEYVL